MSENIRGITFAEQAVTPADDAIVRRAILGDGVLTGCEVTYSGSTLTLASGYIIACGRSFQITTAQNFAVVDATSGVARLLLTIDLTQTATEETFNQISFSIEYAAAEDGFVGLIQDDINLSGTKYQIVCAVVSLGTGGIAGIVSKLERTEGGGGGLNFKVVPGLTQPGTASENTIWVKAEKIGAWYFSATQPENMQEWDVWFQTGTESAVKFNALRKNVVQVYPFAATQYVNGILTGVDAKIYQNGEWVDWIKWIIKDGQARISVDGVLRTTDRLTVTYDDDYVDIYVVASTTSGIATSETLNVESYREIVADLDVVKLGEDVRIGLTKALNAGSEAVALSNLVATAKTTATGRQTITLNISSVSGNYYPCILLKGGSSSKDMQVRAYDFYLQ